MGTLLTTSTMIKLLLGSALLALSAAAPALPYVGATVGAVAHVPVVKSDVVTPAEVEHEVTAHTVPVAVGYHGHPYGYYGKRSADAEPAVLAGASRVVSAPTPLIHNPPVLPAVTYAAHPLAYAGYAAHPLAGHVAYGGLPYTGLPVLAAPAAAADEAVVAERKKREAEPQVLLNGAVLPYAAAPATFATVGAVAHAPVVKSVDVTPAEVNHEVTAHAVPVAVGYHGLPYWG